MKIAWFLFDVVFPIIEFCANNFCIAHVTGVLTVEKITKADTIKGKREKVHPSFFQKLNQCALITKKRPLKLSLLSTDTDLGLYNYTSKLNGTVDFLVFPCKAGRFNV